MPTTPPSNTPPEEPRLRHPGLRAIKAAWLIEGWPIIRRATLSCIGAHCNKYGRGRPGMKLLARGTGAGVRSVIRAVAELKALGAVKVWPHGYNNQNRYQLQIEVIEAFPMVRELGHGGTTDGEESGPGGTTPQESPGKSGATGDKSGATGDKSGATGDKSGATAWHQKGVEGGMKGEHPRADARRDSISDFFRAWISRFEKATGEPPTLNHKRVAGIASKLLAQVPMDRLTPMLDNFFGDPFARQSNFSITLFAADLSRWQIAPGPKVDPRRQRELDEAARACGFMNNADMQDRIRRGVGSHD